VQREAAREDTQSLQEALLGLVEQVVGPVDRRAQRLVAFDRPTTTAAEHPEAVIQTRRELARGQGHDSRRRELDRKGDSVEASAHLRDRVRVRMVESEVLTRRAGALDEQTHGVTARDRLDVRAGLGNRQ
jgi:hypothetical protein